MRIRVVATFHTEDSDLVRRRHCLFCSHRWYTFQPLEVPVSKAQMALFKMLRR